jgi:hypothetical protein
MPKANRFMSTVLNELTNAELPFALVATFGLCATLLFVLAALVPAWVPVLWALLCLNCYLVYTFVATSF